MTPFSKLARSLTMARNAQTFGVMADDFDNDVNKHSRAAYGTVIGKERLP
jgi:hypothetical protein